MRIDTGSTPPAPVVTVEQGGDTTQLRRYLRAIRRRWPVLLVFVLLGVLVGWVSTPSARGALVDDAVFYQATHTLLVDTGAGSDGSGTSSFNLDQAAFLANKGDVSQAVADRLKIPISDVEANVSASALGGVSSIQVTAVSPDAAKAVTLADTTSEELTKYLTATADIRYQAEQRDLIDAKDKAKAEQDAARQKLAADSNNPELQAEYDSAVNAYTTAYERFTQFASAGKPTLGLSTVQAASAQPITRAQYTAVRTQIASGPDLSGTATTTTLPTSSATASTKPASAPLRAAAGGFMGLLLGIIAALLLDRYDTRLRQREELEAATGLPVLAEIPQLTTQQQHETEVVAFTSRRSRAAEAYRVVRTALIFAHTAANEDASAGPADGRGTRPGSTNGNGASAATVTSIDGNVNGNGTGIGHGADDADEAGTTPPLGQVVMVTSPGPDEGKTTTVSNLAAVLAEGGLSVLVINCDFRRPRIQKYLLEKDGTRDEADQLGLIADTGQVRAVATMIPRVRLVTGIGEGDLDANPIEIVAVQKRLIAFARMHYDIVLLDTAPFLTTNDASDLLVDSDSVIMVARCGKTRKEAARRAAELLFRLEAPLLGTVLTDSADAPSAEYYYHYYLDDTEPRPRSVRNLRPGSTTSSTSGPVADSPKGSAEGSRA
ncbi:MAG: tyrosine-protein kinase family protein [Acidimicrobiales bacterium]